MGCLKGGVVANVMVPTPDYVRFATHFGFRPVQCIYETDPSKNVLFSENEAGSGVVENTHRPNPEAIAVFGDSLLYLNTEGCASCTACYQPDVCPVSAIYSGDGCPLRSG